VLPAFADSDRLLKFFMTNPTSTGCARAKAGISAVLQLKTALHAAPRLASALTSSGEAPPTNEVQRRTKSRTISDVPPSVLPALPSLPPSPQVLRAIVGNLASDEIGELCTRIHAIIDDEAIFRKQSCQGMLGCLFAVRSKVSVLLMAADGCC
jgi:hypothetical protein